MMQVYQRYGPALVRKAERMLHNREDALDIVQGLFVDLWQRGAIDVRLPFLYRCITNRCLNLLRDEQNRQRLLAMQEPALRGPVRIRCDDRAISLDLLLKLVARLDETSQKILVYRFLDELGLEEIAALVGLSRKSVGKRLVAIQRLVATLGASTEAAWETSPGGAT
jgi:RNA polymerase sigma-70 factor, ECF subfamily